MKFRIITLLLMVWQCFGATYYVDATTGDDTNTGLTEALAWEYSPSMTSATGVSDGTTLVAGDIVLFKCDEVWREQITVTASGTVSSPITFGAYGTGSNPLIISTELTADEDWTEYYNNAGTIIYRINYTTAPETPRGILEGGLRRTDKFIDAGSDPETVLTDNLTAGAWTVGGPRFYYRKDSGVPTDVEIATRNHSILLSGVDYVIIENIDCNGPTTSQSALTDRSSIQIEDDCSNMTVRNLTLKFNSFNGLSSETPSVINAFTVDGIIGTDNGSTPALMRGSGIIKNCLFYDNGTLDTDTEHDRGGISVVCVGGSIYIQGNELHTIGNDDNDSDSTIISWQSAFPVFITGNYIHDVKTNPIQIIQEGIDSNGTHIVSNNIITNYGTTTFVGATNGKSSGIRLMRTTGVKISNNVFSKGGSGPNTQGIYLRISATNTDIKNNIFDRNTNADIAIESGATVTGLDIDNNQYYVANGDYEDNWFVGGVGYDTLAEWQVAIGGDGNSQTGDPKFVDAANDNYYLTGASPCKGAGAFPIYSNLRFGTPVNAGRFRNRYKYN